MKDRTNIRTMVISAMLLVFSLSTPFAGNAANYAMEKATRDLGVNYYTVPIMKPIEGSVCWTPCINDTGINYTGDMVVTTTKVSSAFDEAADLYNDGNREFNKPNFEVAASKYNDAIKSAEKALAFMWYNRGCAQYYNMQKEEALLSFENALKVDPNYENALQNRNVILRELGK